MTLQEMTSAAWLLHKFCILFPVCNSDIYNAAHLLSSMTFASTWQLVTNAIYSRYMLNGQNKQGIL